MPNKMFGSVAITLKISNEEMNVAIKTAKSLEESGSLIKRVRESIKNEAKERKSRFLDMLLGPLGASLFGKLLTGKCTNRVGEGTIRVNQYL